MLNDDEIAKINNNFKCINNASYQQNVNMLDYVELLITKKMNSFLLGSQRVGFKRKNIRKIS